MAKFRKKPVVIEAMQFDGTHATASPIYRWSGGNHTLEDPICYDNAKGLLLIKTLEGVMTAQPGDWIIRGVKGEFYPCKPDIFSATYEAI
jgi:hypothetical protein